VWTDQFLPIANDDVERITTGPDLNIRRSVPAVVDGFKSKPDPEQEVHAEGH